MLKELRFSTSSRPVRSKMTPRGAQRQRALVVVLRHFLELGVLNHLEEPEPAGQQTERDTNRDPQHGEASREPPPIFGNCHKR